MNDKPKEEEESSFADLVSFDSLPPPPGSNDVHSARTTVAELPDSFLESLKGGASAGVDPRARVAPEQQATRRARPFELPTDAGAFPADEPATSPAAQTLPLEAFREGRPPRPQHVPRPPVQELAFAGSAAPPTGLEAISSDELAAAVGAALSRASAPALAPEAHAHAFAPEAHAQAFAPEASFPVPLAHVEGHDRAPAPVPNTQMAALDNAAIDDRAAFFRRVIIGLAIAAAVGVLFGLLALVRALS